MEIITNLKFFIPTGKFVSDLTNNQIALYKCHSFIPPINSDPFILAAPIKGNYSAGLAHPKNVCLVTM